MLVQYNLRISLKFQKNPVILLAFGYILRKKGCNFCLESNYQKVHLLIIFFISDVVSDTPLNAYKM